LQEPKSAPALSFFAHSRRAKGRVPTFCDLRKAIERNAIPEYSLAEIKGANGPSLSIYRDSAKAEIGRDKRWTIRKNP